MRRYLIALVSLSLAACGPVVSITEDPEQEAAADRPVFAMFVDWADGISWQAPEDGTNDETIYVDDARTIVPNQLPTRFISATFTEGDFRRVFADSSSRNEITAAAQNLGWEVFSHLDADGPTGTQWGYKLTTEQGIAFLIVNVSGIDCESSDDAPAHCLNFHAKVSETTMIPLTAE